MFRVHCANHLDELLIMRNNNQLKTILVFPRLNDVQQRGRKPLDIVCIKVGGRLIQCQNPAIGAKGLCQTKSDDNAAQDLLSS